MKKVLIPLVSLFAIIFAFIYLFAGGLNKVVVVQKKSEKIVVIGKSFEGSVKSDTFSNLYIEIETFKKSNNYKGNLGAIYFNNPENSKGNINAFLGVLLTETVNDIPEGFEKIEINSANILEGKVKASNVFGISISKVYNAIFSFAEENNLTLEEYYVEYFPTKDEVVVQIRIKDE